MYALNFAKPVSKYFCNTEINYSLWRISWTKNVLHETSFYLEAKPLYYNFDIKKDIGVSLIRWTVSFRCAVQPNFTPVASSLCRQRAFIQEIWETKYAPKFVIPCTAKQYFLNVRTFPVFAKSCSLSSLFRDSRNGPEKCKAFYEIIHHH